MEWKEGTSDTHWGSLSSDTCPNLRCHKYDLLTVESLETEWTKDLKINSRIVVASEAVCNFLLFAADKDCGEAYPIQSLSNK